MIANRILLKLFSYFFKRLCDQRESHYKPSTITSLLILPSHIHGELSLFILPHRKQNRPATYRAIFNVFLRPGGGIDNDLDPLRAIGTGNPGRILAGILAGNPG